MYISSFPKMYQKNATKNVPKRCTRKMYQSNVPKNCFQKMYPKNVLKKCFKKCHKKVTFWLYILFVHFFNTCPWNTRAGYQDQKNMLTKNISTYFVAVLSCTCMPCGQVQLSTATRQTERILVNMYCHQNRTRHDHRSKRQPYLRTRRKTVASWARQDQSPGRFI
jgi:hypothetical protein